MSGLLADFYGVTTDYLLARTETKSHPNASLSDLCLSDDMIELLKNKRIDTALLCELATHPDFVKLLADIQIYVEGIASMQIQNLNAWVDVARAEIMEKYQPDEHDKTTYLLQSAHVDEGDYFSSRVHKDMDGILVDLRKAHIGRSDGAPKSTVAEELKRDLEEVVNFEGSYIRVPMSHKACADFAVEQASKGNDNTSPFLIIEDKDKNRVGMASPSIEDSRVGVFTSGIFIKPEFQRKGYAKEAIFMIMKFYFNELRCQKFNASVYSYNEPSNRLCEKIGLVVEGRRRNTVFTDGKFFDEILYGLTKDEFSELIK